MEYFALKCPLDVKAYVPTLLDVSVRCVQFDPNYADDDESEDGMEIDNDDDDGFGSEDEEEE
jgi:cullin-associated NEDD8-dissociated protein 1